MTLPSQVKAKAERTEQMIQALQQPETPETPTPAEAAPPTEDWHAKYEELQTRHKVLQGKYDAEVPRYAREIRALKGELENATTQADALRKQVSELQEQAQRPAQPDPDTSALTETYGSEVVQTIERIAERKARELVQPLQGKVEESESERRARAESERQAERGRKFAEAVSDLVPDWEQIDAMPEFQAYMQEVLPDGSTRQNVLMEAVREFDAASAARVFIGFKRTQAPPPAKDKLQAQLVPDNAGRPSAPPPGKHYSKADIQAFYKDVALGKIDPNRAAEIERDIESAYRENRVS